jgi:hypothetical protein
MRIRKWLGIPVVLLVIVALLLWAADRWLESPSGRARLQSAMTDALNVPVHLDGDFNISLWPSVGISGRDLTIGDARPDLTTTAEPGGEGFLMRCATYHASVALWPLMQGRLVVLAVRAADGDIEFTQPGALESAPPDATPQALRLPRIDLLRLENFRVPIPGVEDLVVVLGELEIAGFQLETATPLSLTISIERQSEALARLAAVADFTLDRQLTRLSLDIGRLGLQLPDWKAGPISGTAAWDRLRNDLSLRLEGQVSDLGHGVVSLSFSPGDAAGLLKMEIDSPVDDRSLAAAVSLGPMPEGIALNEVVIESMGQQIRGRGCWRTEFEPSLNLDLQAESIDLDRLLAWLPESAAGDAGFDPGTFDLPIDLRARLTVGEIRSGGVVAQRVSMAAGGEPGCPVSPD